MRFRGVFRRSLAWVGSVGALFTAASCYRAEVDLAPLLEDPGSGSGGIAGGDGALAGASMAGERGEGGADAGGAGGEAAAAGAGGAAGKGGLPKCDPTPDDATQAACRKRLPTKEMCDEEDEPGWAGCYNGGCRVCVEVLVDYPFYLERHPCCEGNTTCGVHSPLKCSHFCPPPTALDKRPMCYDLAR